MKFDIKLERKLCFLVIIMLFCSLNVAVIGYFEETTQADTTPPHVMEETPSDGSIGVHPNRSVEVVFNESMNTSATPQLSQLEEVIPGDGLFQDGRQLMPKMILSRGPITTGIMMTPSL